MATTTSTKRSTNGSEHKDIEAIEEQIATIREDIAKLGKIISEIGSSKAESYAAKAGQRSSELIDASNAALKNVQSEAKRLETDLEDRVRGNPLQALGIAAGIGFALALLTRK